MRGSGYEHIVGVDGDIVDHDIEQDALADEANDETFGDVDCAGDWEASRTLDRSEVLSKHFEDSRHLIRAPVLSSRVEPRRDELLSSSATLREIQPSYAQIPPSLPAGLPAVIPFTQAARRSIIAGNKASLWCVASRSLSHSGLMTARDKETIMKTHLTQIAASAGIQDWRGKFVFGRSQAAVPEEAISGGKRLYASVHHPRKNLTSGAVGNATPLSENFARLKIIEDALTVLLQVDRVDEFIKDLHPLAAENLEISFHERTGLLMSTLEEVLSAFPLLLAIGKGRTLLKKLLFRFVSALAPVVELEDVPTAFGVRMKRLSVLSSKAMDETLQGLDELMAKFLFYGGEGGDGDRPYAQVITAAKILGHKKNASAVGTLFANFTRSELSRFLLNHPVGVNLLTALLPFCGEGLVPALCDSCEAVYKRLNDPQALETKEDLWNLLVAVLQRGSQTDRDLIQSRIGSFLQNHLS